MKCDKCDRVFENEHALWGHKASCNGNSKFTAERLRELYHGKGMCLKDIAQKLDCGQTNVIYHMDRHGIERRSISESRGGNESYQDEDTLEKLYWDKGLSLQQIGERLDANRDTIRYWMDKLGIKRRERLDAVEKHTPSYFTDKRGYERIANSSEIVGVHQLVAIANGQNPHKVFADGIDVHHKTNVPWDNRPDNLDVLSHSEHQKITSGVYYKDLEYEQK